MKRSLPRVGDLVLFLTESGKNFLALVLSREPNGIRVCEVGGQVWSIDEIEFSIGLLRWIVVSERKVRRKRRVKR